MFSIISDKSPLSSKMLLGGSFIFVSAIMLISAHFFEFVWQTNDDIGMSMIAHGYGISVTGSPTILFSNIIWGYIVRTIPTINGVVGYSIATLVVLFAVGVSILYGLLRLKVGVIGSILIFMIILIPSLLFSQFTINAGLLMIAALIYARVYAKTENWHFLLLATLFAYCSYLIRSQEFWLISLLALPLLPWRALMFSRQPKIAFFTLLLAVAISAVIDNQAYQGKEWKAYNELNPVRALFTDYGVGKYVKERKDLLGKYNYSANDIDLIENWFFVDPAIANPQKLSSLLKDLDPLSIQKDSLTKGLDGLSILFDHQILYLGLFALLLAFVRPNWRIFSCWLLYLIAAFAVGLIGRPGILRVFIPAAYLLLVAPFILAPFYGWRRYLSTGFLLLLTAMYLNNIFLESQQHKLMAEEIRKNLINFPQSPVIIWGGSFPYEWVYPILNTPTRALSYQHYGLGVSTLAPFTVAAAELRAGRDVISLLNSEKGLPIMEYQPYIKMLKTYCHERLKKNFEEIKTSSYVNFKINQVHCV